jgi:hypothetical protein
MLRRLHQAILFAIISFAPLPVQAVGAMGTAEVVAVHPTRVADLVILGGGFESGFRQGMVCRLTRGQTEIAEILLVELRPAYSAALILSMTPNQSIRAGDIASVKVYKS